VRKEPSIIVIDTLSVIEITLMYVHDKIRKLNGSVSNRLAGLLNIGSQPRHI